ncbi:MAG TPA: LysM peptidoglycan-binding domain-containing protein [Oculatellaceae cyanobacterium]
MSDNRNTERTQPSSSDIYKVQSGDSLWKIAKHLLQQEQAHVTNAAVLDCVRKLAEENHLRNPNKIFVHEELHVSSVHDAASSSRHLPKVHLEGDHATPRTAAPLPRATDTAPPRPIDAPKTGSEPRTPSAPTTSDKPTVDKPTASPGPLEKSVPTPEHPEQPSVTTRTPEQPAFGDNNTPMPQTLSDLDQAAQANKAKQQEIESKLWGDSSQSVAKYVNAKTELLNVVLDLQSYTPAQQAEFNDKYFGSNLSVVDKQKFIDSFAAKDSKLHDAVTNLLQRVSEKLPLLAEWQGQESASFNAALGYYKAAADADKTGDADAARRYWSQVQSKYPVEVKFLSAALQEPQVVRMDAKMTGDYLSLFTLAAAAQNGGDIKGAESLFRDSIAAADSGYAQHKDEAAAKLKEIAAQLKSSELSGDDKLKLANQGFSYSRILSGPVEARLYAGQQLADLQALGSDDKSKDFFKLGQGGAAYQAEIAGWLRDAGIKSKDLDTASMKTVGQALANAVNSNVGLNKPENADDKKIAEQMRAQMMAGADLPVRTEKYLGEFLMAQHKGTDAITAIREAGTREAQANGWKEQDITAHDNELAQMMTQAQAWDTKGVLSEMRRRDDTWKTGLQAFGGLAAFALAMKFGRGAAPELIEKFAPALAESGALAGVGKGVVKYAPAIMGTAAASGLSIGIDSTSATHEGIIPSVAKGLSLVALMEGGKQFARVGSNGLAPSYAQSVFGAATKADLTESRVIGRLVTQIGGKPLAESEMTSGQLLQRIDSATAPKEAISALGALKSLPENTRLFENGVLNPAVSDAFVGTKQVELAGLLRQGVQSVGATSPGRVIVPSLSELRGALRGTAIDVENGDINALNREIGLRTAISNKFAGSARLNTEKNVLVRLAGEVSGDQQNLTKSQLLAYAKARKVPADWLKGLNNVASEGDPLIIKNGTWNPDLLLKNPESGSVTRLAETQNFDGILNLDNMRSSELYAKLSRPGATQDRILARLAQHINQDIPLDANRGLTKKALLDGMTGRIDASTGRAMMAEDVLGKYPKLNELRDSDMIVRNGKLQKALVSREIPDTMTKRDLVAWYKENKGVDLNDPEQLAKTSWAKSSLAKAADDATIIKDGSWKIKVPQSARETVGERNVNLNLKSLGLTQRGADFAMTASRPDMTAGQLADLMRETHLDPTKVEGLTNLNPDTVIVKNGSVLPAFRRSLGPVNRMYRLVTGNEGADLKIGESQLAVMSGDPNPRLASSAWSRIDGQPFSKALTATDQFVGKVAGYPINFFKNAYTTRLGLSAFDPALHPATGSFRVTGAGIGLRDAVGGTLGTLGAYTGYEGLMSVGGGHDDWTGKDTSSWAEFQRRMSLDKGTAGLYSNLWLLMAPKMFTEEAGPVTTFLKRSFFGTNLGEPYWALKDGLLQLGPYGVQQMQERIPEVKAANARQLVDNPSMLPDASTVNPDSVNQDQLSPQ